MQLGFVGLGKMGGNMVHRIHRDSEHTVVAWDRGAEAVAAAEGHGATGAGSLGRPRRVWSSARKVGSSPRRSIRMPLVPCAT